MASMSAWAKAKGSTKVSAKNKGLPPVKTTPRKAPSGSAGYLKKGQKKK